MGVVPAAPGFLEALRALCDASGALLVFDEVITGFRVARGGAQELYGVEPDLTILGKIVGGGLPLAAFGGRADLMERLAPAGGVYQAGTLSGNPLATAAGLAVLPRLRGPAVYAQLQRLRAPLGGGPPAFGRGPRGAALRPLDGQERQPVFSPLGEARYALGLETIYEAYLLHYGRPRLFAPPDRDGALLLGDYLYAHGLVRIALHGQVAAVVDLAELVSLCAYLRAEQA